LLPLSRLCGMTDENLGERSAVHMPLLFPEGIKIIEGDGAPPPPPISDAVCAITLDQLDGN